MNIVIITPFRNARHNLKRYFSQISSLRDALLKGEHFLSLIAAEGDSVDGTRQEIVRLSGENNIPLTVIDTTHGHMSWASVEDPVRLETMSNVMNTAFDAITDSVDIDVVVWIMSDLEWPASHLQFLIDTCYHTNEIEEAIFAPLVYSGSTKQFYDSWAYRKNGERFKRQWPYHPDLKFDEGFIEIDSAGTCLVMPADAARSCRADKDEAVSFCADARQRKFKVYLSLTTAVRHINSSRPRMLLAAEILCSSGSARATHEMLPVLSEHFDLDIVGINYHGTPHNLPYRIWPAELDGAGFAGEETVARLIYSRALDKNPYDIVLIQGDIYNLRSTVRVMERTIPDDIVWPTMVGWTGLDGKNPDVSDISKYDHLIVWTEFSRLEIGRALCSLADPIVETRIPGISVVPLGVDLKIFKPITCTSKIKSNYCPSIPFDSFVIGFIGRNQYRKRLDLLISVFSRWTKDNNITDAYLYLHSSDARGGVDIPSLVKYYGLEGRVILNQSTAMSDYQMVEMISCFDVYLTTTQGEGFGLPVLEAMACGKPCIVPAWSGLGGVGGWTADESSSGATRVACTSTAMTAPMNGLTQIIGGIVNQSDVINVLDELYNGRNNVVYDSSQAAIDHAAKFSWDSSREKFIDVLRGLP